MTNKNKQEKTLPEKLLIILKKILWICW
jgi:hypothetical protein